MSLGIFLELALLIYGISVGWGPMEVEAAHQSRKDLAPGHWSLSKNKANKLPRTKEVPLSCIYSLSLYMWEGVHRSFHIPDLPFFSSLPSCVSRCRPRWRATPVSRQGTVHHRRHRRSLFESWEGLMGCKRFFFFWCTDCSVCSFLGGWELENEPHTLHVRLKSIQNTKVVKIGVTAVASLWSLTLVGRRPPKKRLRMKSFVAWFPTWRPTRGKVFH